MANKRAGGVNRIKKMIQIKINAIITSIPKIIPSPINIERRIKKIPQAPAVKIRQIGRRIPAIKAVIANANAIEIIRQVKPAQPKVRIDNARAKIINPNRQRSMAATIPVMLTSRINRERQSTDPAINVIVSMRQIITSVKNGMAVAIMQQRAVRQNPIESSKQAADDKQSVVKAKTNAVNPRHATLNPSIIQIKPPNGNRQHPNSIINRPDAIIPSDKTNAVKDKQIMAKHKKTPIIASVAARHNASTMVIPAHKIDNASTKAINPHRTTDNAMIDTVSVNGATARHITPRTREQNMMANARTRPIAPVKSKARNKVGEQTTSEQIQDKTNVIKQIDPRTMQIAPIMDRMRQAIDPIIPVMQSADETNSPPIQHNTATIDTMNIIPVSSAAADISTMIETRITRTIMLSMKMIIGTITKPSQLQKNADARVRAPNITAMIMQIILSMPRIMIAPIRVGIPKMKNIIYPMIGQNVSGEYDKNNAPRKIIIANTMVITVCAVNNQRMLNNNIGIENGKAKIPNILVRIIMHGPYTE